VKLRAYSSISAFLAHYHALRAAAGYAGGGPQRPLTADERRALAEMDALLRGTLTEGERVALGLDGAAVPAADAAGTAAPSADAAATPPGASSAAGSPPHDVAGREAPLGASSRPATTTHPATNGATARRRARAELKLRHALAARSLLTP
jgi:hypothetical protein